MTLEPGTQLGPYRIEAPIGSGGFAVVYRAHDARLDTTVALKVLAENHAFDSATRSRFADEARALRAVNSVAVISVFDVGVTPSGQPFMVLDYADRGSLDQRFVGVPARERDVFSLVTFLGQAMHDLHQAGLVHRDIKPSNVLLQSGRLHLESGDADERGEDQLLRLDDRLLLSDLGLAKDMRRASGITVGAGSPGFAAPEQLFAASQVDFRADLYAATALVASAVLGRRLRHDDSWRRVLASAGLPGRLRTMLARGLSDDPADRPGSAIEWRDELVAALRAEPLPAPTPRRNWRSVAAVGALALVTLATAFGLRASLEQGVGAATERVGPTVVDGSELSVGVPIVTNQGPKRSEPIEPAANESPADGESSTIGIDGGADGTDREAEQGLRTRIAAAELAPATSTPTPTPTRVPTPVPTVRPTATPTAMTPTATTPTATSPTATSTPTPTAAAASASATSATSTPNPTTVATFTPTATAVATSTPAPTSSPTPTITATPTATPTPSATPTPVAAPTAAPAAVPLRSGDISIVSAVIMEEDPTVEVRVRLRRSHSDEVSMNVATIGDSATPGSDYHGVAQELVFPSGSTEQSFEVNIIDDGKAEEDEVFDVRVYTLGPSLAVGEVRITDAVDRGEVEDVRLSFVIAPLRVDEDAGVVEVEVTMNPPQASTISHMLATNNNGATAEPGSDYWGVATSVVFAPGATTAIARVEIIDDADDEPDETLNVRLYVTPGSGKSRTLAESTITITDNDEPWVDVGELPTFSVEPIEIVEGTGTAEVIVTLDPPASSTTSVSLSTVAGTAVPGEDFFGTFEEIEFAAGQERATVPITLIDDAITEPTETFTVRLFDPDGAELGDTNRVDVTIVDDD